MIILITFKKKSRDRSSLELPAGFSSWEVAQAGGPPHRSPPPPPFPQQPLFRHIHSVHGGAIDRILACGQAGDESIQNQMNLGNEMIR